MGSKSMFTAYVVDIWTKQWATAISHMYWRKISNSKKSAIFLPSMKGIFGPWVKEIEMTSQFFSFMQNSCVCNIDGNVNFLFQVFL